GSEGDAGPGVGGVGGRLLVTKIHHLDPEVDTAVIDGRDVSAGEREQVRNALVLQSLRDKLSAMSRLFHHQPRRRSDGMVPAGSRGNATSPLARTVETDWRAYDLVAEVYERVHAPRTAHVARDLVALARPPADGRILDVGAGTGASTFAAQEALGEGGLAVGVDPSLPMLTVDARTHP